MTCRPCSHLSVALRGCRSNEVQRGLLLALLAIAPCPIALAAPLDPNDFASLGSLNVASGTLTINTTTLQVSGAATFNGLSVPQSNGPSLAVFTFDDIAITGGNVVVTGTRPLVLLSKSDLLIVPTLNLSAPVVVNPGPGGYSGTYGGNTGDDGIGPGGGHGSVGAGATGGGHGGSGGHTFGGSYSLQGGSAYGDLWQTLQGGSGGGGTTGVGGGGGGAVQLSAVGDTSVGTVLANGGGQTTGGVAGGAGGGILITGESVTYGSMQAAGGTATTGNQVTGGGGGRIEIAGIGAYTLGSIPPGLNVAGGANANATKTAGFAGVITIRAAMTVVPIGQSVVLDGGRIINYDGFDPKFSATLEAIIERNLTVNTGGSVALGKSQPLQSDANLVVNGTFDSGSFSQVVASLSGDGAISLGLGGELIVGQNDASSSFTGDISGVGQLGKVGAGTIALGGVISHTGGTDVAVGGPLQLTGTFAGAAGLVKTGPGTLEITNTGLINTPGANTHVAGGQLLLTDVSLGSGPSMVIADGARLTLNDSSAPRAILGNGSASRIETIGTTTLGDSTRFDGFRSAGVLDVTGATTIQSRGAATLGALTSLNGTLTAPNGVTLGAGANLVGIGSVNAKVAAGFGSLIAADGGDLTIGSSTSVAGFFSDGDLATGAHTVTINDANEAVLGSLTTLGDGVSGGTLVAGTAAPMSTRTHLLIEQGKNLVGRGNVVGNVKNHGAVIGDGLMLDERVVFDAGWTVSGIGDFENVLFNGTFAPGLSPGVVAGNELAIGGKLAIEIGGATPGNGVGHHDQVNDAGVFTLVDGATLTVDSFSDYVPEVGQRFTLATAAEGIVGGFASVSVDPWFSALGLGFDIEVDANELVATVVAGLSGDFNSDGLVDAADYTVWRDGFGSDYDNTDLAVWKGNYGVSVASATAALAASVPEPAAMLIAMLGVAFGFTSRRSAGL